MENKAEFASSPSTTGNPTTINKSHNAIHGNLYHAKLLTLVLIRATVAKYQFELATEMPSGGKFDDLVFRYIVQDASLEGKHWRYRYVQAKHKREETNKIAVNQLLDNKDNDFSLKKYFRSYRHMTARGEDIHDCIICTNIGVNETSLNEKGIELVLITDHDDIFAFKAEGCGKTSAHYKLKMSDDLRQEMLGSWSDVQSLADILSTSANNNTTLDIRHGVLQSYHVALVKEKVIDLKTGKFHQDFVNKRALTEGAMQLRKILKNHSGWKDWKFEFNKNFGKSKAQEEGPLPLMVTETEICSFFNKLVFISTPNEVELDQIRNKEISNYFQLKSHGELPSSYIFNEMLDWFKDLYPKSEWMTLEDGKKLLDRAKDKMESIRITNISTEYQEELEKSMKFNDDAISEIAQQLESYFVPDSSKKLVRIRSSLPKCTAAKVLRALKTMPIHSDDSYQVMQHSRWLQNRDEMERLRQASVLNGPLILVYDNDDPYKDDQSYLKLIDNTVVLIGNQNNFSDCCLNLIQDTILYRHMGDDSKKNLFAKIVSFQGIDRTVKDLIGGCEPDEVLDSSSIQELMFSDNKVTIPSGNEGRFEKFNLYINRRVKPFEKLQDKISEEPKSPRQEFFYNIADAKTNLENDDCQTLELAIPADELIDEGKQSNRLITICGLAGTGKSTLLSHYYEEIKNNNPNKWVIRTNLLEHYEAIMKWDTTSKSPSSIFDLFINHLPTIAQNSSFSASLLRYRFETDGQLIVMLDGFDEIDSQVQDKVIELIKVIIQTKVDKLYITTRPHLNDKLLNKKDEMFKRAYNLENFDKEDQIHYLCHYWENNLKVNEDSIIRKFADSLVGRMSETLKDDDRFVIGIPLQCYILAICFQSELQEFIRKNRDGETRDLKKESGKKFDLVSLYKSFINTKQRVFREEKTNAQTLSPILSCAMDFLIKRIDSYHTKLAIEVIEVDQENVELLWPHSASHKSQSYRTEKDNEIAECTMKFGLTCKDGKNTKVRFLHRTFAEYLFAKYLCEAFLLDDDKHNKLLDNEPVPGFVFSKILVHDKYYGVRVFLDAMMKEIVESAAWRNLVNQRKIPIRLQKFARYINSPVEQQLNEQHHLPAWSYKALATAVPRKSANIFKFIFDCFDATLDKADIRKYLVSTFENNFQFFNFFYDQSTQIFKRCLDYYNDADDTDVTSIMEKLLNGPNGRISYLSDSRHNREESRENIKLLIEFVGQHRQIWKRMQKQELDENKSITLSVFILNEYYDGLFEQYLELLLWLYADSEKSLADIWNSAISWCSAEHRNGLDDRIAKMLTILSSHVQTKVLDSIARYLLRFYPGAFEKFYLSSQLLEEDMSNVQLLLERHSGQMTRLHHAAFSGDTKSVTQLLETVRNNLSIDADVEGSNAAKEVVNSMTRDDYGFTPLYIAATRCHEEVCRVMLQFLKDILPPHQLRDNLTDENGFLYKALWDTVKYSNSHKFQVIMNSVVQTLGGDYLVDLLNAEIPEKSVCSTSMFSRSQFSCTGIMPFIIKTLTKNDVQDGKEYGRINKLIFREANAVKALVNIDAQTLGKMLEVNGCKVWTKQLLYTSIPNGFYVMSSFFEKLDSDKLTEMVSVITLTGDGKKRSYWAEWIDCLYSDQYEEKLVWCYHFVQQISKYLGDKHVKEILLHDDGKVITRAFLLCRDKNFVNAVLTCLSNDENRSDFAKYVLGCAPQLIQELFLGLEQEFRRPDENNSINMSAPHLTWTNILNLFVTYADDKQLPNLINIILKPHKLNGRCISIWSDCLNYGSFPFNSISEEQVDILLKCVSEKCGENTVKELVLHGDGIVITHAFLYTSENLVKITLAYLSEENRSEVGKCVIDKLPQIIEEMIPYVTCVRWMNTTQLIVDYAESHQLSELVRVITTVYETENGNFSIWSSSLDARNILRFFTVSDFFDKLHKLFRYVSEKLGEHTVKQLIFHNNNIVTRQAAVQRNEILLEVVLAYLNDEDKKEVRRLALLDSTQMPTNSSD